MTNAGWVPLPSAPGAYYFVGAFGDDAGKVHVYNVCRKDLRSDSPLFVAEKVQSEWWGPDPSTLALSRPGLWKRIPDISEEEMESVVRPGLTCIKTIVATQQGEEE